MILEGEFRTADNPRAIRVGQNQVGLGLKFLDAQFCVSLAVVARLLVRQLGRVIVDFEPGVGVLLFLGIAAEQAGFGALEIKVVHFVGAGLDLLDAGPGKDAAFRLNGVRLGRRGGAVL